jgi:anti-sigma B factor antagonist
MDGRLQCEVGDVRAGELRAVVVRGEVDLATAADLESVVRVTLEEAPDGVVLDLAQLAFIDSSGLRALVALSKDAESRGTSLALRNLPRHAKRVLELTGLDDWFEVT